MKTLKTIKFGLLAIFLALPITSCANIGTLKNILKEQEGGDGVETPVEPEKDPFEDFWRDNDFLEDPNRRPDREPWVDTTPEEEEGAIKNPYHFEFEEMRTKGNSQGQDHLCIAKSFEFNTGFSGNVAMCNNTGTFILKFESDKNVKADFEIGLAHQDTLGGAITILNNKHEVADLSVEATEHYGPGGAYFDMARYTSKMSVFKGANTVEFVGCTNIDYITFNTSANIEVIESENPWTSDIQSSYKVVTVPSATSTGKIQFDCSHPGCANNGGRVRNLPILTDSVYIQENDPETESTKYFIEVLGEKLLIAEIFGEKRLTLEDCTFEDDSTSKTVLGGTEVNIKVNVPQGKKHIGFVNVNDETEIYDLPFVMPNKDITIKPLFETINSYNVTLQDGLKFEDGTTTKELYEGDKLPTIKSDDVVTPSDKQLVGAVDEDNNVYDFDGTDTMPTNAVTLKPAFDVSADTYSSFDGNRDGKLNVVFDKKYWTTKIDGWGDNIQPTYIHGNNPHYNLMNFASRPSKAIVGEELGARYRLKDVQANTSFTTLTKQKVENSKEYTFTLNIQNYGTETLKMKFYHTGSSGSASTGNASEIIEIAAGEVKVVSFDSKGINNNNVMIIHNFVDAKENVDFGMSYYIATKA